MISRARSSPSTAASIYGTIDRTFTDSTTQGVTLQLTGDAPLFGLENYFTAGGSIDHSAIAFRSNSTLARIFPISMSPWIPACPAPARHSHPGQSGVCAGRSGRHHRLLRALCGGCAGPDRCPHRHGGLSPQCRRIIPRPQRHNGGTDRQSWLWPYQSPGRLHLQDQWHHHPVRRLFSSQPRAHAAGTGLRQPASLACWKARWSPTRP